MLGEHVAMVFCGFSSWDVGILRCCTHYDLIITLEQWMNRNFGYKCKGQKWERTRIVLVLDSKLNNKIYQLFMLGSYIFRTWNFVWKVYIAEAYIPFVTTSNKISRGLLL